MFPSLSARHSLFLKLAAAILIALLADQIFMNTNPGSTLGAFAAAGTVLVLLARAPTLRLRPVLAAAALALVYAAALFDDPGPLAWALGWLALSIAVLAVRHRPANALGWIPPLLVHALAGPFRPLRDLIALIRLRRRRRGAGAFRLVTTLALPVIGGLLFLALFTIANPVIETGLRTVRLPGPQHFIFIAMALCAAWPLLRPWAFRLRIAPGTAPAFDMPSASLASVLLALATFNAIFAIQNGLDIAFLWSGAPLPGKVTLADYAHRGAYSLIATALIAGVLSLWMLRPGSAVAADGRARALLVLWVIQNLLLVASSMLRTIDYVQAFSLTELRISALLWMLLVGIGLVLICWTILRGRSVGWLVNANVATAGLLLTGACFVDLSAVAAHWNVSHAREAGGNGPSVDICYLARLDDAAVVPLIRLEQRAGRAGFRAEVAGQRVISLANLERNQRDWRTWTWRNARRLARARAMLGPDPAPVAPRAACVDWLDESRVAPAPARNPNLPPQPAQPVPPPQPGVTPAPAATAAARPGAADLREAAPPADRPLTQGPRQ
ncbi:DUF4173 domain-containing protein [Sphingomonas sanxanigenens]|uniref:Uncharacterized protein n=1 Tax=Sphingomonas sanxanigenens DSM 19645 = NX02 TaxID=1123269 RepID=W0AIE6_9SPHN|nr:DUF4173 domain-containing protein [Sphingomonas sanxanigenens]AHE56896.1 hypothetical protein NX02_26520 [Sphingomonas sanxanigenens DSM 19645 = NX02]